MSRDTPTSPTRVRWCLVVGLACGDQRRLTGTASALGALRDDALYKSTYFTFTFFGLRLRGVCHEFVNGDITS